MGISNKLSDWLETSLNHWATVKITDAQVQQLIQSAMAPNKEVLQNIRKGQLDELSTCFQNICRSAFEYAMTSPTQLTDTTKGTLFGAYNAVTGYFQNARKYSNPEAKLKSLFLGGTAQTKAQKAFTLCEDFAKMGDAALHLN